MEQESVTVTKEDLQKQVDELRANLTGDMFSDMEALDKIHNLEMSIKGVRPTDSYIECIGCGS